MLAKRSRLRHECLEARMMLTASPWTNPLNRLDTTGDGQVTSRDALVTINHVTRTEDGHLANVIPPILGDMGQAGVSFHYDVTGDGKVSSLDALRIINALDPERQPSRTPAELTDQPGVMDESAHALVMSQDYGRAEGEFSAGDRDAFRFRATRVRTTVNLATLDGGSNASVRVLDAHRNEIASSDHRRGRAPFEGFDFQTESGSEYFVIVEGDASASTDSFYVLEVYQYNPERWVPQTDSKSGDDIHGDSIAEATRLEASDGFVRISSHIDPSDDRDVFEVVSETNRVSFEVFGLVPAEFETSLSVRDRDGNVIPPVAQLGGAYVVAATPGESLYATVVGRDDQAGQYVLDVTHYERAENSDDTDGDTIDDATLVRVGREGVELYRSIDSSSDVDVFRFQAPLFGPHHVFLSVGGYGQFARVDFEVLDRDGAVIDVSPRLPNPFGANADWIAQFNVDEGEEYFVRVFEPNNLLGQYVLTLGFLDGTLEQSGGVSPDAGTPDASFGDDIHDASFGDATELTLANRRTKLVSHIDFSGDEDVFRIPVNSNALLTTVGGNGITLEAFDDQRNPIEPANAILVGGVTQGISLIVADLDHIFVRVHAFGTITGRYLFEVEEADQIGGDTSNPNPNPNPNPIPLPQVTVEPDAPFGDDIHASQFGDATEVALENSVALVRSNVDSVTDTDLFRIPVTSDTFTVEVFSVDAALDVGLEVLDEGGNPLTAAASIGSPTRTSSARFERDDHDFAFVRVASAEASTGEYLLRLQDGQYSDNVGDTLLTAVDTALSPSNGYFTVYQELSSTQDVDIYRIPNALPGSFLIGGSVGISIDLFDENGQLVPKADDGIIFSGAQAPTYQNIGSDSRFFFIRISTISDVAGPYLLSSSLDGEPSEVPGFAPIDLILQSLEPDSEFGDDPHGDDIEHSTPLFDTSRPFFNHRTVVTSFLDSGDDVDVFHIQTQGISRGSISLRGEIAGLQISVFDRNGNEFTPDFTAGSDGLAVGFNATTLARGRAVSHDNTADLFVHVSSSEGSVGQYSLSQAFRWSDAEPYILGRSAPRELRNMLVRYPVQSESVFGVDEHGGEDQPTPIDLLVPRHDITSYLDRPFDRDAFRFTATYREMFIALAKDGNLSRGGAGQVELFDAGGNPVPIQLEFRTALVHAYRTRLEVGQEYTAVVSAGDTSDFDLYYLQFQPLGDAGPVFNTDDVIDLEIDETLSAVNISGVISSPAQVDFYRFSAPESSITITRSGIDRLRMQVFLPDGTPVTTLASLNTRDQGVMLRDDLPGGSGGASREFLLAVWNPDNSGDYKLRMKLLRSGEKPPIPPVDTPVEDIVGDTFEDAQLIEFEPSGSQDPSLSRRIDLNSSGDVDVFEIHVGQPFLEVELRPVSGQPDPRVQTIGIELFDSNGNQVQPLELSEKFGSLLDRLRIQFENFPVIEGEKYFLRFENNLSEPFSAIADVRSSATADSHAVGQ